MSRYNRPQSSAQIRASADRKLLEESRPCLKHNVYYQTHRRMGGRIVPTVGCEKCQEDRLAEWKRRDEVTNAAQP
jgi:hypothetical protein